MIDIEGEWPPSGPFPNSGQEQDEGQIGLAMGTMISCPTVRDGLLGES